MSDLTRTGKPRGTCPDCGRRIMLLSGDRIGKHGAKSAARTWPPQNCTGWGKPAVVADAVCSVCHQRIPLTASGLMGKHVTTEAGSELCPGWNEPEEQA